ncbi:MAG: hypothetical protein ABIH18_02790 [Candidatus Omnitrophota bacterium]
MSFANDKENVKCNKRPFFITLIAILTLISIPVDFLKVITLDKNKYQDEITRNETLIKDGKIKYHNRPVYWEKQSDFRKKIIISQLAIRKKILSKLLFYKVFQWAFVFLNSILFYALWKMKKWVFRILVPNITVLFLFNILFIFNSMSNIQILLYLMPGLMFFLLIFTRYKKYFIY